MSDFKQRLASSFLAGANASYLEAQYEAYLEDPTAVPEALQRYFRTMGEGLAPTHSVIRAAIVARAARPQVAVQPGSSDAQSAADQMVATIRRYAHLAAHIDPLGIQQPQDHEPRLALATHTQSPETTVRAPTSLGGASMSMAGLHTMMMQLYAKHVAVEFEHIEDEAEQQWLYEAFEKRFASQDALAKTMRAQCLKWLSNADALEKILGEKYPGQKRFSLEGGDTLIPMLQHMVQLAARQGMSVVDIGMAHRGRLNVLVNVMGKAPDALYKAFEGKAAEGMTSGDVKYHLGFSSDVKTDEGSLHLSLACNPSHLEIISPVVLGVCRARQDAMGETGKQKAMAVLIHGDAAFAGQGVVMESFALANTPGYGVGGSLHIVVNNQVGFTTSNPKDARSSRYCSDAAKMIQAPVLHVNGDDPEAAMQCVSLAMAYRERFGKDIVIDLVCFRRHGHQEVDEPFGTQPLMYQAIKKKKALRVDYGAQLVAEGVLSNEAADLIWRQAREHLSHGEPVVPLLQSSDAATNQTHAKWSTYFGQLWTAKSHTQCELADLKRWADALAAVPEGFQLQKQVQKLMQQRAEMAAAELPIDWGFAESLAYASLLDAGHSVRITGQDVRRGTFFHRHTTMHDQVTGQKHLPLAAFSNAGCFSIYDSILSEVAVLAFEYGYATKAPDDLVIWEAQFGDFANGAQVVIDQFLSAGWQKWERLSGVVLQLPHGQEGQGPEHSSARLERYLQLAAQDNIQVCAPTKASQLFHMLRRQVLRPYRRPLVVMSPKSMLRHPGTKCDFESLARGTFEPVLVDGVDDPNAVTRVIACSGKICYDLLAYREANKREDVAIIRLEQLYPFPEAAWLDAVNLFPHANTWVWCQEEPENQGAWWYMRAIFHRDLAQGPVWHYAGRDSAAAPAVGYPALHAMQQKTLVEQAFGPFAVSNK